MVIDVNTIVIVYTHTEARVQLNYKVAGTAPGHALNQRFSTTFML